MTAAPQFIAFPQELDIVFDELRAARQAWRVRHARDTSAALRYPERRDLTRILRELGAALFPLRLGPPELNAGNEDRWVRATLESVLSQLAAQIGRELRIARPELDAEGEGREAERITGMFAADLPRLRAALDADIEAGYANDPAARGLDELLLTSPAIEAIIHHRIAHRLHELGAPLVARVIAEIAHVQTGIDIHPGARIGHSFFIDHGTGTVIGETAVIGNRVRIFQGVTLGGAPLTAGTAPEAPRGQRRHPAIGDGVTIFPGAVLLGPISVGAGSSIGGNVWLREDVPAGSVVEASSATMRPRD